MSPLQRMAEKTKGMSKSSAALLSNLANAAEASHSSGVSAVATSSGNQSDSVSMSLSALSIGINKQSAGISFQRQDKVTRKNQPVFNGKHIQFPGSDYCSFKGSVSQPSPYKTIKMLTGKESNAILLRAQQAQNQRTSALHHKHPNRVSNQSSNPDHHQPHLETSDGGVGIGIMPGGRPSLGLSALHQPLAGSLVSSPIRRGTAWGTVTAASSASMPSFPRERSATATSETPRSRTKPSAAAKESSRRQHRGKVAWRSAGQGPKDVW